MALLSFAVGLPAHLWSVWWPISQHFAIDAWYSTVVPYQFSRFTALGHVALIILAIKAGVGRAATRVLACVGQMAFTNYILTSLICTTIFEGYGFGSCLSVPEGVAISRRRPLLPRVAGRVYQHWGSPLRAYRSRSRGRHQGTRLHCAIFRLPDVQSSATSRHRIAAHRGNCNSCITAWKRGSLRKGSMSGSAFVYTNPGSRSRIAFSSQSKAALRSPH